ncbi:MAG: hypothetical protein K0R82_2230 [Flavipsychrobacter sp.]|jgi:hypothetical protein|nr:hypothetical protein [Flavipsychrobacter sp.]
MNGKVTLILSACLLAISLHLNAQHTNGWFRGTAGLALSKNWRTESELQGRWQNGLNNSNPLEERLLFSYRHWLHYQHSEALQFGLSPFAYYTLFKIIEDSTDYDKPPTHEYRLTVSADLQHRLFGNLCATDKTMLEYRMFDGGNNILRLRNKLGLNYRFKNAFTAKVAHEVLLNVAGTSKLHFFDHERTSISTEFNVGNILSMEVGYMHASRLPLTSENTIAENNLLINFGFKINRKDKQ